MEKPKNRQKDFYSSVNKERLGRKTEDNGKVRKTTRTFIKWLGIILGIPLALILALVLALYFFDWNTLRKPISSAAGSALDRPFAIKGDMRMDWSWTPVLTINGIELGNAPWSKNGDMLTIDRVQASVRLRELFKGHIVLPEVEVDKLRGLLEKNKEGKANWNFAKQAPETKQPLNPRWVPQIDRLNIKDSSLRYVDAKSDIELDMNLSTALGKADEQNIKLSGQGKVEKEQFTLKINGGSVLDIWNPQTPFPLNIDIAYGKTTAKVSGTIQDPIKLENPDLKTEIKGLDLSVLRPFTSAWIPLTPPYRFSGEISRKGETWLMKNFEGKLGNSDLSGDFSFRIQKDRPLVQGDLTSKKLDFRDFAGFVGGNPKPDAPERPKLLPDKPYDVEGLRVLDADVQFKSGNIITPFIPLDVVSAEVKLDRGMLEIKPFKATIEAGRIAGEIQMDARKKNIQTIMKARIDKVPFKRLLKNTQFEKETAGMFMGNIELTAVGNSIAEMAANSNGGITVLMENGRISSLLVELAGLDILQSLGFVIKGGNNAFAVPCSIFDFIATEGILKTKLFLIETTDSTLSAKGQVNLKNETLDLRFVSQPKDVSLLSVNTPILITGSIKQPKPRPEAASLGAKAAASIGLGLVGGPAAILPWVDFGLKEDSPCQSLLKAASKQDNIPRPGKKPKNNQSGK